MGKTTNKSGDEFMFSNMADHTQKVLDNFFVHQCIVRRFYKNNTKVFNKLVSFRTQIEAIIKKDLGCSIPQAHVVYYIMNAMQNSKILALLENNDLDECRDFLFKILEPIHDVFQTEVKCLLSDDTTNEIIRLMSNSISIIFDIMNQTNIFRYYTLYASTIIVNFESLVVIQKLAEAKKVPTYALAEYSPTHTKWLSIIYKPLQKYPEGIFEDLQLESTYRDLYCLIACGGIMRKFNSENIKIIDDRIGDVVIDGKKSDGKLYLSVPYTKLPTDIDEAIRLFKNSITNLLIEEGICRYNTEESDYWHSNFYNKNYGANTPKNRGDTTIVLVKQKNSLLKLQSGLLVWDKVKIGKSTIEISLEETCNLIGKHKAYSRSESSIKKDYDYVAALINPESKSDNDILSEILSKKNDIVVK